MKKKIRRKKLALPISSVTICKFERIVTMVQIIGPDVPVENKSE